MWSESEKRRMWGKIKLTILSTIINLYIDNVWFGMCTKIYTLKGKMGNRQVEKYSVTHMMLSECRESCRVSGIGALIRKCQSYLKTFLEIFWRSTLSKDCSVIWWLRGSCSGWLWIQSSNMLRKWGNVFRRKVNHTNQPFGFYSSPIL